ncbi:MAG: aspartyl/asparaginyl beta-hydroxylase domain-containing protein [Candidatus Eremiobacteraeota bacterium]|nr:aspartyl/asparaginyl beta-hydroxylase domain-containing protein [Candidatus Eremiobacteraeota bacterium]
MTELLGAIGERLRSFSADVVPHGRWSLYHHLLGTAEILEAWLQPFAVCAAGMVHSIYSTEAFGRETIPHRERDRVRELVGAEAEWLSFLFCALHRQDIYAAASKKKPARRTSRWDGDQVDVTSNDLANLVILHMANIADQSSAVDRRPAPVLANLSRLAILVRGATVAPPIFDSCSLEFTTTDEQYLLEAYEYALNGRAPSDALPRLTESLPGLGRSVSEPLIAASLLHLYDGNMTFARSLAMHAIDVSSFWNTSWDKRLSHQQWRRIAKIVASAASSGYEYGRFLGICALRTLKNSNGSPCALYTLLEEVGGFAETELEPIEEREASVHATPENAEQVLPSRFATYVHSLTYSTRRSPMLWYPQLSRRPWYDPNSIPLGRELVRRAPEVIAELCKLDDDEFHGESERIRRSGRWDVLMLLERGIRNEEVARRCPVTMEVLNTCDAISGPAGLAYVSRLSPGSKVASHCGPTNLRLRCHLGVDIPEGCGLRVGSTTQHWQTGSCLLFDDSFDHEAWNLGSRDRIVLIVDVWHPELTLDEIILLDALHREVFQQARNLSTYWSSNERSRKRPRGVRQADHGAADGTDSPSTTASARA